MLLSCNKLSYHTIVNGVYNGRSVTPEIVDADSVWFHIRQQITEEI